MPFGAGDPEDGAGGSLATASAASGSSQPHHRIRKLAVKRTRPLLAEPWFRRLGLGRRVDDLIPAPFRSVAFASTPTDTNPAEAVPPDANWPNATCGLSRGARIGQRTFAPMRDIRTTTLDALCARRGSPPTTRGRVERMVLAHARHPHGVAGAGERDRARHVRHRREGHSARCSEQTWIGAPPAASSRHGVYLVANGRNARSPPRSPAGVTYARGNSRAVLARRARAARRRRSGRPCQARSSG
jgi:hypothetical protein